MPGDSYIDIPNPYTATQDGWAILSFTSNNEGYVNLSCNNGFTATQQFPKAGANIHVYLPIKKGQTVSFAGLNFTSNTFRFY